MSSEIQIVLSTYNGEKFLNAFLESLCAQSSLDFQLMVRDDGSTDKSVHIVEQFKDRLNIDLVIGENIGFKKSYKELLTNTTAQVVYLADQDDIWLPNKIACIQGAIEGGGLVHSDAQLIDEYGDVTSRSYHSVFSRILQPKEVSEALVNPGATGCTIAVTQDLIKYAYSFEGIDDIPHDRLLFISAAICKKIRYIKTPLVQYRIHAGNTIGINNKKQFGAWRVWSRLTNSMVAYRSFVLEGSYLLKNLDILDAENRAMILNLYNFIFYKKIVNIRVFFAVLRSIRTEAEFSPPAFMKRFLKCVFLYL